MECPLCRLEGRVQASRYVVEHDDTPDMPTELYDEFEYKCVNKNCPNNGKVFDKERIQLKLG